MVVCWSACCSSTSVISSVSSADSAVFLIGKLGKGMGVANSDRKREDTVKRVAASFQLMIRRFWSIECPGGLYWRGGQVFSFDNFICTRL